MDISQHLLVLCYAQCLEHAAVIRGKAGEPLRAETGLMGGKQQIHADRSAREHLLDFGDFVVFYGVQNHSHDAGRETETGTFLFQAYRRGIRQGFQYPPIEDVANPVAGCTGDQDEAPWPEAAVIRNVHRFLQQLTQGFRARAGVRQVFAGG
jgi:hypothetical protein